MKKLLLLGLGFMLLAGAALAQSSGPFGVIQTSPVVVPGSFNYNGGPQVSIVRATGGTFVATGATSVTVANTTVTANSVIVFGLKTVGGTPAGSPYMFTVTPGTGFTVRAVAGDTSTYNYWILG